VPGAPVATQSTSSVSTSSTVAQPVTEENEATSTIKQLPQTVRLVTTPGTTTQPSER
jgi:hypothetical protein